MNFQESRIAVLLVIVLVGTLSGCLIQYDSNIDPRPGSSDVDTRIQSFNGTTVSVRVDFTLFVDEDVTFENVTLCGYTERGEVLVASNIGSFSTPSSTVTTNVSVSTRPTYLFIEHPGFDRYGVVPEIVHWTNDSTVLRDATPSEYIQEFNYHPPEQPGNCGTTS